MKLKLSLVLGVLAVALSAVVAVAAPSASAAKGTGAGAPTQLITGTNGITGTFTVTSFKKVGSVIRAFGTFKGTDAAGNAVSDTGYADVLTNGTPGAAAV